MTRDRGMKLSIPTDAAHDVVSRLNGCIVNKDIVHLHVDELVATIAQQAKELESINSILEDRTLDENDGASAADSYWHIGAEIFNLKRGSVQDEAQRLVDAEMALKQELEAKDKRIAELEALVETAYEEGEGVIMSETWTGSASFKKLGKVLNNE